MLERHINPLEIATQVEWKHPHAAITLPAAAILLSQMYHDGFTGAYADRDHQGNPLYPEGTPFAWMQQAVSLNLVSMRALLCACQPAFAFDDEIKGDAERFVEKMCLAGQTLADGNPQGK